MKAPTSLLKASVTLLAVLLSMVTGPLAAYGTSSLLLAMVSNGVIPEAMLPGWAMSGWLAVGLQLYIVPLVALLVSPVAALAVGLVAAVGFSKTSGLVYVFGFATLAGLLAGAAVSIAWFILYLF